MPIDKPYLQERLLDEDDVQEMVGLSHATIWRLRRRKEFPQPLRIGRARIRYRESEIIDWIASRPKV